MSNYIKLEEGAPARYPYTQAQLRAESPNTSFPSGLLPDDLLAEWGMLPVIETPQPVVTSLQNVIELPPVLIDGVWTQQWAVLDATPEHVAEHKRIVWEAIKRERDMRKAGGVNVGEHWFHSDADSRIQQIGLVMMGANIPANLQWKTMSGAFVTMAPALAGQIFAATAAHDQAAFAVAEQHRIAMEASTDPAAYDYSAGWPAVYGEQS